MNLHVDALTGLASVSKGEIGRTIAVDLILAPSHEMPQESILVMPQESILVNTKLGPS